VSGSAEAGVSVGAQVGIQGSAHATYEDNTVSIGIDGKAAVLLGIDADVDVDIDLSPIIDGANAILDAGGSIDEATMYMTDQMDQAQQEAIVVANDAVKVAEEAENVANDVYSSSESTLNAATNAVSDATNSLAQATADAANAAAKAAEDAYNASVKAAEDAANAAAKAAKKLKFW